MHCFDISRVHRTMRTRAGTLTLLKTAHGGLLISLLAFLLSGCGSGSATQPVLAAQCMQIGGSHDSEFTVTSPGDGVLRINIDERGISVVTSLADDPQSAAESPVERLGSIQLVSETRRG